MKYPFAILTIIAALTAFLMFSCASVDYAAFDDAGAAALGPDAAIRDEFFSNALLIESFDDTKTEEGIMVTTTESIREGTVAITENQTELYLGGATNQVCYTCILDEIRRETQPVADVLYKDGFSEIIVCYKITSTDKDLLFTTRLDTTSLAFQTGADMKRFVMNSGENGDEGRSEEEVLYRDTKNNLDRWILFSLKIDDELTLSLDGNKAVSVPNTFEQKNLLSFTVSIFKGATGYIDYIILK